MNNAFVIEAAGEAAGLIVRERSGFRFFAATPQFAALERQLFRRGEDAARAARALSISDNRPHRNRRPT